MYKRQNQFVAKKVENRPLPNKTIDEKVDEKPLIENKIATNEPTKFAVKSKSTISISIYPKIIEIKMPKDETDKMCIRDRFNVVLFMFKITKTLLLTNKQVLNKL